MKLFIALLTLGVGSNLAAAQPTSDRLDAAPTAKSETTALELSAAGTAVGAGLLVAGIALSSGSAHDDAAAALVGVSLPTLLMAPSLGEMYSGRIVTLGMGIRLAGMLTVVSGAAGGAGDALGCEGTGQACNSRSADVIVYTGVALIAAGAIYDIAMAPRSARTWNHEHHLTAQLVPTIVPTSNGGVAGGVGLVGAF